MSATVSTSGNIARISLAGDFDFAAQDELKRVIEQAVSSAAGQIVIDMENTSFIDSSAIRILLKLRDTAQQNQQALAIVNCNEHIREIFRIGGFDQIFDIQ